MESNKRVFDKHRHGTRDAHAKSHGILKGGLTIYDNLPETPRQGIFKKAATYPVIIRLSSAPGDIKNDRVPAPFGMAIKVIDVEGEQVLPARARENAGFSARQYAVYCVRRCEILLEDRTDSRTSRRWPLILSKKSWQLWQAEANKLLEIIGHSSPTLYGLSPKQNHILGETFYSMAAIRYGDYFEKSAAPLSENVQRLTGEPFDAEKNPSLLRDLVKDFSARRGGIWTAHSALHGFRENASWRCFNWVGWKLVPVSANRQNYFNAARHIQPATQFLPMIIYP